MERESCLAMLVVLIGEVVLLGCGWWLPSLVRNGNARQFEEAAWRQLWLPVVPGFAVTAWLCGWALTQPDPVPTRAPISLILTASTFALVFIRAAVRAAWSLVVEQGEPGSATVGLLRPWVLISPRLVRKLDDRELEAVLQHERAHARHRDPLRIWLAQFVTDLLWPWPQAEERLRRWLVALEFARDEEARLAGVQGSDLASAVVTCAQLRAAAPVMPIARLASDESVVRQRVDWLLGPFSYSQAQEYRNPRFVSRLLGFVLVCGLVAGMTTGATVIHAILRFAP